MPFSVTPDSISQLPEASVAVCAHDAGAASHMVAWLAPMHKKLRLCLTGPAERLFYERLGSATNSVQTLDQALDGAQMLISGTGWTSDLEHQARLLARSRGITTVAVLDHWCNYRERFMWYGQEVLPDQFWVSDVDAALLAQATFPGYPVQQLPNFWLEGICSAVKRIRYSTFDHRQPKQPARRLLYLLEPIRVPWISAADRSPGNASEAGEIQALHYWLKQLPNLIEQGWVAPPDELEALVLRPHPSEPAGKYDAFIADVAAAWPIQLDQAPDLSESLAWADAVFGCETQALIAAMACDLTVFSTIPPWAPPCVLPHKSLLHLSRLVGS